MACVRWVEHGTGQFLCEGGSSYVLVHRRKQVPAVTELHHLYVRGRVGVRASSGETEVSQLYPTSHEGGP
jgi:hypothetical protein